MAAADDLLLEISRGRVTGATMTAAGISAVEQYPFQQAVERHDVNPVIPATAATALGASTTDTARNLTRRTSPRTSGR